MAVTALPANFDIRLYQGDDYPCAFLYAEVDEVTQQPLITSADGWSAHSQIRDSIGGDVWLDLTDTAGLTLSVQDGYLVVAMLITSTQTTDALWSARTIGVWDLEVVSPSGLTTTIYAGRFYLTPDVTREG